jgi:hypothetical protein
VTLKNRLSNQWKDTNSVTGVVDAIDDEVDALDAAIDAAIAERSVAEAGDDGLEEIIALLSPHLPGPLAAAIDTIGDTEATRRLALGLAAANRSFGSVDDIIRTWDAMTLDLGPSEVGLVMRLDTVGYASIETQIPHSPTPLDDPTFRDEVRKILCRSAGPSVNCAHDEDDLLADGSFVFPDNAKLLSVVYGVSEPTTIWGFQETSGDIVDLVDSNDLTLEKGIATYEISSDFSRVGVRMNSGSPTANFVSADTDIGNGDADRSFSIWIHFFIASGAGFSLATELASKWNTSESGNGWRFRVESDGRLATRTRDVGSISTNTMNGDHTDAWIDAFFVNDHVLDEMRIMSSLNSLIIPGVDIDSNTEPMRIGEDSNSFNFGDPIVAYAAVWDGYAITQSDVDQIISVTGT